MADKKMAIFFGIFLLIFIITLGLVFFSDNIRSFTRAGQSNVSLSKSLMIASELETVTSSEKGVNINVFARNVGGMSLANKKVTVSTTLGSFNISEQVSDNYGKTVFNLKSKFPGTAVVKATIDNQPLPYELKIKFNQ